MRARVRAFRCEESERAMSHQPTALNKIVAVEKTIKANSYKRFTELHQQVQKTALLGGISRTYRPRDDDGDQLPAEENRVQLRASEVIREVIRELTRLFDVVATKDWGNMQARADIKVDDEVLLRDVPVTYLLFLEKQLTDLRTFVTKLPALDASEAWSWDQNQNAYATAPVETHRTKKVPRVLVKYEATEEHPAQTEVWYEDVVVGYWKTIKYSGALPAQRIQELTDRIDKLLAAVKYAREEANRLEVEQVEVGRKVLEWVFRWVPQSGA